MLVNSTRKVKVGLALGSGGVRGAAHFGVILTMLKHGVDGTFASMAALLLEKGDNK